MKRQMERFRRISDYVGTEAAPHVPEPLTVMRQLADLMHDRAEAHQRPGALVSTYAWHGEEGTAYWQGMVIGPGFQATAKGHTPGPMVQTSEYTLDYTLGEGTYSDALYVQRGTSEPQGMDTITKDDVQFLRGMISAVRRDQEK